MNRYHCRVQNCLKSRRWNTNAHGKIIVHGTAIPRQPQAVLLGVIPHNWRSGLRARCVPPNPTPPGLAKATLSGVGIAIPGWQA